MDLSADQIKTNWDKLISTIKIHLRKEVSEEKIFLRCIITLKNE